MPEVINYRELDAFEQQLMFNLYCLHKGNVLALSKDERSLFASRSQITHYRDLYDWHVKFVQNRTKEAEELLERLRSEKIEVIEKILAKKKPYVNRTITKDGKTRDVVIYPDLATLRSVYDLIKLELGEPLSISKSSVDNDSDKLREIEKKLVKIIDDVKTEVATIQPETGTGTQTPSEPV